MGTKGQKRSATNKANRAVQEIYHTHGSKPFNITQEEKEKDKGGPISRGDLFLATHKAGKKEWLNKETQDMYVVPTKMVQVVGGMPDRSNDLEVLYRMEGSPEANPGDASAGGVADTASKSSFEEEERRHLPTTKILKLMWR
ncbi:hypothetical protein LINPERHAP2_LOCUS25034 [Linum perenne]